MGHSELQNRVKNNYLFCRLSTRQHQMLYVRAFTIHVILHQSRAKMYQAFPPLILSRSSKVTDRNVYTRVEGNERGTIQYTMIQVSCSQHARKVTHCALKRIPNAGLVIGRSFQCRPGGIVPCGGAFDPPTHNTTRTQYTRTLVPWNSREIVYPLRH